MTKGRRWARSLLVVAIAGTPMLAGPAPAADAAAPPVAPDDAGHPPAGWVNTQWGFLGPADRYLLENVRRANLWEGDQASVLGIEKGTSAEIKRAGKILHDGHIKLETDLRQVAAKLNVSLPTTPNADQETWLNEMRAAKGTAFDAVWVDRLRAAHGKIFSAIASVRANTRNSLVRSYSYKCSEAVAAHMDALEKTGLVQFNALPTPDTGAPAAAPAAATAANQERTGPLVNPASSTSGGLSPVVIWALLIVAFAAGGVGIIRVFRTR